MKTDATDSFGEVTWNWAYEDSLQVDGDSIRFTDSSGRDVTHDYVEGRKPVMLVLKAGSLKELKLVEILFQILLMKFQS